MKKAFTLVELLAVITIIAIIALIATPIVVRVINESKVSTAKRSSEFLIHAAEDAYLESQSSLQGNMVLTPTTPGGNTYDVTQLHLDNAPTAGTFTIDPTTYQVTINSVVFGDYICSGTIENVSCSEA